MVPGFPGRAVWSSRKYWPLGGNHACIVRDGADFETHSVARYDRNTHSERLSNHRRAHPLPRRTPYWFGDVLFWPFVNKTKSATIDGGTRDGVRTVGLLRFVGSNCQGGGVRPVNVVVIEIHTPARRCPKDVPVCWCLLGYCPLLFGIGMMVRHAGCFAQMSWRSTNNSVRHRKKHIVGSRSRRRVRRRNHSCVERNVFFLFRFADQRGTLLYMQYAVVVLGRGSRL